MIVLDTTRLLLRHVHPFDEGALGNIFGDAEVMRYGPGAQNQAWVRAWIHDARDSYQRWGFGPWAVVEKSRSAVIGYCGLFYFPDIAGQPEIEIGYRFARRWWGQGYATEAAQAVRDYAFGVLCLPRLVALIEPQNLASIRVAEKLGMRYEKEVMLEGYSHPDQLYVVAFPKQEA